MRRTKIVCTIGPASSSREMLDRLVAAGMDVARLNFSHGTHEEHAEVMRSIREGEATWGHPVTIVQDLQSHGFTSYVALDLEGRRWRFAQARPTQPT